MKKYIYPLLAAFAALSPALAEAGRAIPGEWQVHNTLDSYFQETIDTQDRVYVLALGQMFFSTESPWDKVHGHLFVLDKRTGELTGYNAANYLTGNEILDIAYNPAKGYLLIIYDDYSIDLLYDDDTVRSVPGMASAFLGVSRNVNSVTFDPEGDRVYLATDFGYVAIDDENRVISEARVYNTPLNGIARVGDWLVLGTADGLFTSPLEDRHMSLASFTPVEGYSSNVKFVLPLGDDKFSIVEDRNITLGTFAADGTLSMECKSTEDPGYYADNRDGYFLRRKGCSFQLDRQGEVSTVYTDKTGYGDTPCGSWDMADFYFPTSRIGVVRQTYVGNYTWVNGDTYVTDAPQAFGVYTLAPSDKYGMFAGNDSYNRKYSWLYMNYTSLVSAYKDGSWSQWGRPAFADNPLQNYMRDTHGPVFDPLDPDCMWMGSTRNGMMRVNLADHSLELFAHPSHEAKGQEGFHAVFPTSVAWPMICIVSAPSFDADGNLWCIFNPSHAADESQPLYCWKAADRKAGNVSAFKNVPVKGYTKHYENFTITAAKHPASKDFVYFVNTKSYFPPLYVFNHGGTIDDTSDDKLFSFTSFRDQDGNTVSYTFFNTLYEDPATGLVWVGLDSGLFIFDPADAMRAGASGSPLNVVRVKPKGSYEYLLSGYNVMSVTADACGRKWFGTAGDGIIVTSADGSEIIDKFNTANSSLPSDEVYAVGYEPATNAIWVGGARQLAAYYCDALPAYGDFSRATAWPNPVRPGHQGHVTLRGLASDTPLRIADSAGGQVKDLGIAKDGVAVWDLTDDQGRQVSTGIYYLTGADLADRTLKISVVR